MQSRTFTNMTTLLGLRFGPVRKGVTPKRVLDFVLQDMVRIKDDNLLTSDAEDTAVFKGMFQAYRNVAHYIAPLSDLKDGPPVPTRIPPIPPNGG
jgi:hypothetical protein